VADPKKIRADANVLVAELLERLAHEDVRQLEIRRGGVRVRVSKNGDPASAATTAGATTSAGGAPRPAGGAGAVTVEAPTVNAPLTGIFYRAPSPQGQPYVQIGSNVGVGEVIGLIEAMKLFNEIRSTAAGRVRRIFAENGQLVRAHQPLLELEP
jgi:acetyl-CoA carboxylase biotin carboxyl carrier protein